MRIAIIGCGMIMSEHMEAFGKLQEANVVAAVDIRPERLKIMEGTWKVPSGVLFADWRKMLSEVKPDAVDICLPPHLHCPAALDALEAGCHVYVEKPMAMNAEECRRMIAAAVSVGKKLAVGFQQEYNPGSEVLQNAFTAGFFGKIRQVHARILWRRSIPGWGTNFLRECGGGPILDIASHLIDIAACVMGRPEPVRVTASTYTGIGRQPCEVYAPMTDWDYTRYNVDDMATAHITFANDAVMQVETCYAGHLESNSFEFNLYGEKGGCHWSPFTPPKLFYDAFGAMMNMTPGWLPSQGRPDMFRAKLKNWIDACLTGSKLRLPGEIGLYDQRIYDGIIAAAAKGEEIRIAG